MPDVPHEAHTQLCSAYAEALADANKRVEQANVRVRELEAENAEISNLFELLWKRDVEAVSKWQAAGTGRELTYPDRADLVVFLLEMVEAKDAQLAKANEINEHGEVKAARKDENGGH